jgi:hypothetical protein
MRQKTIEKVAKEYAIESYPYDDFEGDDWEIVLKECEEHFIDGAKWEEKKSNHMEKILLNALSTSSIDVLNQGIRSEQDRILDFLYSEITEHRDYSASKMCEKVIEFIKKV